jgi:hypothetical protein
LPHLAFPLISHLSPQSSKFDWLKSIIHSAIPSPPAPLPTNSEKV